MPKESGLIHTGSENRANKIVELATSKVDEPGMWKQRFENNQKWLFETLDGLSPAEITEAENILKKHAEMADERGDAAASDAAQYVLRAVVILGRLKSISAEGRTKEVEKMAKKFLFLLSDANNWGGLVSGPVQDAIYQLNRAAYGLARFKFPKEWKQQEEAREESKRAEILKKRDELMKKNVS